MMTVMYDKGDDCTVVAADDIMIIFMMTKMRVMLLLMMMVTTTSRKQTGNKLIMSNPKNNTVSLVRKRFQAQRRQMVASVSAQLQQMPELYSHITDSLSKP